jgi:hypothetical protein
MCRVSATDSNVSDGACHCQKSDGRREMPHQNPSVHRTAIGRRQSTVQQSSGKSQSVQPAGNRFLTYVARLWQFAGMSGSFRWKKPHSSVRRGGMPDRLKASGIQYLRLCKPLGPASRQSFSQKTQKENLTWKIDSILRSNIAAQGYDKSDCATNQFFNRPLVICEACGLCGCPAMRRMDAAEVEMGGHNRNRMAQVFQLF